jgi:hypothetical protein
MPARDLRKPTTRANQPLATPSSSKKKRSKKTTSTTDKVAVPDEAPLMDAFSDSGTNAGIFAKAAQSVHDWVGEAMEPQAWSWLSSNLSFIMNTLKSNVRGDTEKRTKFEKLQADLTKHGWKSQTVGCFSEWSFFEDGTTVSATKVNKAIKAATAAANVFLGTARDDERCDFGGGDGLGGGDDSEEEEECIRREAKAPANPARGTREENELPFYPSDLLAEELASPPPFVRQVTSRTLRAEHGLDQRASAFGLGAYRPAAHQQASGDEGFNMTFGCATTDYREARVLQENPRTGTVMSITVGAPKTYAGLLSLYNKDIDRLESIKVENGDPHPDLSLLRKYIFWFTIEGVKHTQAGGDPKIASKFLEHDQQFREHCNLAGKFSVDISALNAIWALALSKLALTSTLTSSRAYQGSFGQGGSNRGGGGGGWGAARGRYNFHGDCRNFQGNRGTPHGGRGGFQGGRGGRGGRGTPSVFCHDFAAGACNRLQV